MLFFPLSREGKKEKSLFDAEVTQAGQGIGSDANGRIEVSFVLQVGEGPVIKCGSACAVAGRRICRRGY